ncbi:MAG: putative phage abortive infection protein [Methylobacter sp.]|jgi:hypothetical protein|uniref:putative phage abortive infection protein n=1 Tax=Methylobacter sp. TaxID=2051955 RepID=UPI0025CF4DD3|nr:putative phage abortive infection protein [Methylobacter sp.]MCK9618997.1 putative phage abortive infection protein [Methylobacter sp.]
MKSWILPVLVFFIVGIWGTSGFLLIDNPDRGTIGDMFGAVNALFSGLAFAGLIYTIFLQKNELGLQRKELELTREELRGQRETMQAQNEQITLQNFEGTFFQMLRLHNELLNSIDFTTGGGENAVKVQAGRDCFMMAWQRYKPLFAKDAEQVDSEQRYEQINAAYLKLWTKYEGEFGHYFRSLYNVIKFVNNSHVKDKKHYTNIVRAQLSGQELLILLYNCIYHDDSKFTPLIEKYALLKHVPYKALSSMLDIEFYQSSAFGDEYPHKKQILGSVIN